MEENNKPIELRSEEVNEILTQIPSSLIRWGTTATLFVVIVIIVSSYLIKFSETIQGSIELTTLHPPVNLVNNIQGKIIALNYPNKSTVKKGSLLASIENLSTQQEVDSFAALFSQFDYQTNQLPSAAFNKKWNLGEIQNKYINFLIALEELELFQKNSLEFKSIEHIKKQIENTYKLANTLNGQKAKNNRELTILRERLENDEKLFNRGIISKRDLEASESSFLRKNTEIDNFTMSIQQNISKVQELEKQINDLQISFSDKNGAKLAAVSSSYNELNQQFEKWKQTYGIYAPFDGKINYLIPLVVGQYIANQTELFTLVAGEDTNMVILGKALVTANGLGKIEKKQNVNIHLNNFPDKEYGIIKGKVKSIAEIANKENKYEVEIELTNGLKTSYNKTLPFSPKMTGTVDIITKEKRVISKVFENIYHLIQNR